MLTTLYRETIDEVLSNNNSSCDIANKVLYALCDHALLPSEIAGLPNGAAHVFNKEYVAAQLLLISKSYSASFDRRNYVGNDYKGLKDFKVKNKVVGTGTGEFFNELAYRLTNNYRPEYENIINSLCAIGNYDFAFPTDKNESISFDDFERLKKVICAVWNFDKLICKCIKEYDGTILREYKNKNSIMNDAIPTHHYSACSKFLHFHFPSLVFILDFYAERHLDFHQDMSLDKRKILNKPRRNNTDKSVITFCHDGYFKSTKITIKNEQELINKMKKEPEIQKALSNDERYLKFVCRSYLIAKDMMECADNHEFSRYAPRIVDALQSKVNKGLE